MQSAGPGSRAWASRSALAMVWHEAVERSQSTSLNEKVAVKEILRRDVPGLTQPNIGMPRVRQAYDPSAVESNKRSAPRFPPLRWNAMGKATDLAHPDGDP